MTPAARSARASFLVAIAAHGLVFAAVAHAEEHHQEEREDEAEAAAAQEAWRAESGDPLDALAFALAHAHEQPGRPPAGHQHHHSHGPAGSGPHGSGTLSHLAIALHAAPELPRIKRPAPEHAAPAAVVAQLHTTLRYLIPEQAQGPPAHR